MDKFYIDRQFGLPIWIDVEDGIVQNCCGESEHYSNVMNEKYVGKSITFLKEDFIGRAMKGTYHHLRAESITSHLQIVAAWKSKVRNMNGKIANQMKTHFIGKEEKEKEKEKILQELKKFRSEYKIEQYKAEKLLETEREKILTKHNFQS